LGERFAFLLRKDVSACCRILFSVGNAIFGFIIAVRVMVGLPLVGMENAVVEV
jgi:hypothetical protein